MKFLIYFLLPFFVFLSGNVSAAPANNGLYDDELLVEAREQILSMPIAELDEFREYLASCGTVAGGETKRFFCERSARAYILKYGGSKPIEKVVLALAEVEFLVDMVDEAEENDQIEEDKKDILKKQVFKDLERYIVIRNKFEEAMRKAYLKLQ